jgi:hypothetical protein
MKILILLGSLKETRVFVMFIGMCFVNIHPTLLHSQDILIELRN